MQDMDDYHCWASLQWWQEVYRRFPLDDSESTEMNERRNRELAIDACQNMSETPWLVHMIPFFSLPVYYPEFSERSSALLFLGGVWLHTILYR